MNARYSSTVWTAINFTLILATSLVNNTAKAVLSNGFFVKSVPFSGQLRLSHLV